MERKKDYWTEEEVLALPSGESDNFDRKSGLLISESNFERKLAKAVSAFSNSRGGHLIIGVRDDGIIDGVDEFHKGRTKTREWLEQKIPFLLAPQIQNFRVHEVKPSEETRIPQGKIVIVIDIGDSELAPHQSTQDHHYYHRSGGHSVPAPHQYLEFLWKRETYPGPRIASAWVETVLNPLIGIADREHLFIQRRNSGFDCHNKNYLSGLKKLLPEKSSGNFEQFYEFRSEIYELLKTHDYYVGTFIDRLKEFYDSIRDSPKMREMFAKNTSEISLNKLKNEKYAEEYWFHEIKSCQSSEEIYRKIFSELTVEKIHAFLAEHVVNGQKKLSENRLVPFWAVYGEEFLSLYDMESNERRRFEQERQSLTAIVSQLNDLLRAERVNLCRKYGIPFEESKQYIIQKEFRPFIS